jgi:hypothetical protein
MSDLSERMHGHVRPRPDGRKLICAGPGRCRVCIAEAEGLEAQQAHRLAHQAAIAPPPEPQGEDRITAAREALLGRGWVLP